MNEKIIMATKSGIPIFTGLEDAVAILHERNNNKDLETKVVDYLNGYLPDYLKHGRSILLARHIPTPNFETLRFLELTKSCNLPVFISADTEDKFTTMNSLKRSLGNIRTSKGNDPTDDEFETYPIIDFAAGSGKKLKEIKTLWGQPLTEFHAELFSYIGTEGVTFVNDSTWINKNGRGNILEHYKRFLSLCLTHCIMFETYPYEEEEFVNSVISPTYDFLLETFGCTPLIVDLLPAQNKSSRIWEAYPYKASIFIEKKFQKISERSVFGKILEWW